MTVANTCQMSTTVSWANGTCSRTWVLVGKGWTKARLVMRHFDWPKDWFLAMQRSLGAGRNGRKFDAWCFRPQITSGKLLAERDRKISSNHSIHLRATQSSPMASRRLALNLSQGLRSRAGLSTNGAFRRGFATPSSVGKTQTTTLKNGLTVRTLHPGSIGRPLSRKELLLT
jgi:hypothetical protein